MAVRAAGQPAQARHFNDLHHAVLFLVQTDDLTPQLMQLRQALLASIVIAHPKLVG